MIELIKTHQNSTDTAMPSHAAALQQRAEAKRLWLQDKAHRCLDGGASSSSITPERVRLLIDQEMPVHK